MLLFPHRSLYLLEGSLFRRHIVTFLHRCFLPLKNHPSDPATPSAFLPSDLPSFLQPESLLQPTSTQQHPPLILMLTTSTTSSAAATAAPVCASRGSAVVNVLAGGSLCDEVHVVVGGQDDVCHTAAQAREAAANASAQGALSATCKEGDIRLMY